MISLVPATREVVPFAGPRLRALLREMLAAWLAHHQRMAELGLRGGL